MRLHYYAGGTANRLAGCMEYSHSVTAPLGLFVFPISMSGTP